MKKLKSPGLAWQIVIGLLLGILAGALIHDHCTEETRNLLIADYLQPLGDIFLHLIKMIVVPIVVSSLIVGIAGMGDAKKLGRIGFKTIIYFELVTTVAIVVGLAFANIFQPGTGLDPSTLSHGDASQYMKSAEEITHNHAFLHTVRDMVPSNFFSALSDPGHQMLAIIFFSVLFGLGLASLPSDPRDSLLNVMRAVSETMFKVTNWVMRYAPIGVFALIGVTVAKFGFAPLLPLLKLVLLVHAAIVFFSLVVLGGIAYFCGFNIFTLLRILKSELLLAYSTSSSETVLPRIIEKTEQYGAPKAIAGFVVPTGYSFNLDGSTLYQSIAAVFLAQLAGIDLSLTQQIVLVVTLMVTSKGVAGVPGISFVVLAATLPAVGVPTTGLMVILGVDRFMDMARTALNVVGNALAVLVIAKWEGQYDAYKGEHYFETRARFHEERRARREARRQHEHDDMELPHEH